MIHKIHHIVSYIWLSIISNTNTFGSGIKCVAVLERWAGRTLSVSFTEVSVL